MHFFGLFDSDWRSITIAAAAPEGPWKVPTSGLKQADDDDTMPAHVSDTETSTEASLTVVLGVRGLDEV